MWFWSKQHKKSIYILELRPSSGIISRMIVNKSMCNPKPNFFIRCTESVIYYYDRNNDITGKAFCGLESAPTDIIELALTTTIWKIIINPCFTGKKMDTREFKRAFPQTVTKSPPCSGIRTETQGGSRPGHSPISAWPPENQVLDKAHNLPL